LRGAQVEALHLWHIPYVGMPELSPPYPDDEFVAYETQVLDHAITAAGRGARFPRSLERHVVKGHAANELIEASPCESLVVGSHGHGRVAGTSLGSVSQCVVMHADCPVVVIRRPAP
jgi:nucleotide-binding universal stress UspA family protein